MVRTTAVKLAILAVALLAGSGVLWYTVFRDSPDSTTTPATDGGDDGTPDPPSADPRLTFATPFRNVKPGVRYVGDASCASCHGDICTSYHDHPMGRSAELLGARPIERFDAAAKNPWKFGDYELKATKSVHSVSARDGHGAPLPEYKLTADVAIGSGTRGRSYLSIEEGSVWQSPLSWFSKESRWDISPGFDLGNGGRRAITPACLYCHVDNVEPLPDAANRYRSPLTPFQPSIGCERCHGPGDLHVAERSAKMSITKPDTSIVNPKHLSAPLQMAICEQCHLQGQERVARRGRSEYDFRPGLPFEEFVRVFVRHPDIADMNRSVGQFEQLKQSKCTTPAGDALLCTSCHDPHKSPAVADRPQFYRGQCLTCHETKGCKAPESDRAAKKDSCTACHMPQAGSSNIAHTSITDHRIFRRPVGPSPAKGLAPGAVPLAPFHGGPSDAESDRDLGIALSRLADRLAPGSREQLALSRLARDRLAPSLTTWRGDVVAWLAMSRVRADAGEANECFAAAERAVRLAPESELALAQLADAALGADRYDRAEEAATKLIAMNPRSVDHRLKRASVFTSRREWEKAEQDCRAALAIHPLHPLARLMLAACLDKRGDREAGKKELETALGLTTQAGQRSAFRDWFLRETR